VADRGALGPGSRPQRDPLGVGGNGVLPHPRGRRQVRVNLRKSREEISEIFSTGKKIIDQSTKKFVDQSTAREIRHTEFL
jgi:hypothetical protein